MSVQSMKKAAALARAANGEPPLPKLRCCNTAIHGVHGKDCPKHGIGKVPPAVESGDVVAFLHGIQGHPKEKRLQG